MNTELILTNSGDLIIKGKLPEGAYKLIPMERKTVIDELELEDPNERIVAKDLKNRGITDLNYFVGKSVEEIVKMTGFQKESLRYKTLINLLNKYKIQYLRKGGFGDKHLRIQSNSKIFIISGFSDAKGNYILMPHDVLLDIQWLIEETTGELKRALSTVVRRYKHLEELRGRGDEIKNIRGLSPKSQSYKELVKFLKRKGIVL